MIRIILTLQLVVAGLAAQPRFEITSEFGAESAWTGPFLEQAYQVLVRKMDNRKVPPPQGIKVTIKKNAAMAGVGGYATPDRLGFESDQWPKDQYRMWICIHEMVNLFAHHYGGAGGYPSDWWANGRSPFPVYVAALVAKELGEKKTASWLETVDQEKPDQRLFWALNERYGFALFARFFKLVRGDGMDLGRIGKPWPAADERRSAWTIAYLSIAARKNLAPMFREHGIGRAPADWNARHPAHPFQEYVVSDAEVADIMAVRASLFGPRAKGRGIEILRELYRRGETWAAPAETSAAAKALGDSPIEFRMKSGFGEEGRWMKGFLESGAAALVKLLGDPAPSLPKSVPVSLRKADIGGVGGGAQAASIDMVSDCWPKERFRLWIMATELAKLFSHHVGGKIPEDWFGTKSKPFATYAAILVLKQLGHEDEASWVRKMHQTKPDHELFWDLHDTGGFALFAKTFRMMAADGLDVSALPAQVRTPYLAAYLSLAAGRDLVPAFRKRKVLVDAAMVARLMKKHAKLFEGRGASKREKARFLSGEEGR
ncbi:MAG: hypothetical protein CMJ83_12360 [Planctomycetes bacterium]|nr:hypothetical protein [Planctomycetota bacterium]